MKRKLFYVRVVLHRVPVQYIDISESTDRQLVVDTAKFSRKWRLVFPFPDNMVVDSASAEYEFDAGVLRCTFPIKTMAEGEAQRVRDIIGQQKKGRKIKFSMETDESGLDTRVRTRTLDLGKSPAAATKGKKVGADAAASDSDDDDKKNTKKAQTTRKGTAGAAAAAPNKSAKSAATAPAKYVSDADTSKIAAAVASQASRVIKDKTTRNQQVQAVLSNKSQRKATATQHKREVLQRSFLDIVKQKQELVRKKADAASSEPVTKASTNKSVSFQPTKQ